MNKVHIKEYLLKKSLKDQYFEGRVVDNNDPLAHSRIKVEIPELTKGIPTEDLPWYILAQPFNTAPNSKTSIPPVGSRVSVSFPTDDIYNGIIIFAVVDRPPL